MTALQAQTNTAQIQARDLWKTYQRGRVQINALRGVSLDIPSGAFVVLTGPSGSGKSTLLHLLGGIDVPTSGQLRVAGQQLERASQAELTRFRRDRIGFVFQFYNLLPSLNALDNVILPLLARGAPWKQARAQGQSMLDQVGLGARWRHKPGELSGGEQQRVAIARALVVQPAVILADEPTGDLDSVSAGEVLGLMLDLNQRLGVTIVLATHNQDTLRYATRAFVMQDGRLTQGLAAP